MPQEWTQSTTVHAGGKVEVIFPALVAGERVEVTVRKQTGKPKEQVLAALAELRELAVTDANISDEALRRENIYP